MERNYDSDYQVRLATLEALGGDTTKQYDSVYEIDLEILRLTEQGSGADIQTVDVLPDAETNKDKIVRLSTDNQIYFVVDNSGTWEWEALVVTETQVINDNVTSTETTWSSSKIDEELQSVAGTANSEFDGKTTEDFTFVTELPVSGEEGQQVIIKGENVDTLYKYVSDAWVEQTPDANILYFDTVNEALYSYITAEHQFAPISIVNTIVVGKNLNSNVALKNVKEPGVYNVLQRTSSTTKGEYTKKWTLTVEGVDYDEYELTDSVYQKLQSNYTIQKRTWSSSRQTNDGWTTFATYYAGEIKDTKTSKYYTWSSSKLSGELATKQDVLTAGTNIDITNDTISAKGYTYDDTVGSIKQHNIAYGDDSTTEDNNVATGTNCAVFGQGNTATSKCTLVAGESNNASNSYAVVAGYGNAVSKMAGVAFGRENTVTGQGGFAEGYKNNVTGQYAHVEGRENTASAQAAHAEGYKNTASYQAAHAEGQYTTASAIDAHAEGTHTIASGTASHAEGWGTETYYTTASGGGSHAEGVTTIAQNLGEHAEGCSNVSHKASDIEGNAGNTQHSVGVGNGSTRTNAFEIMQNADMYIKGVGGYDGVHIKGQDSGITVSTVQEVIAGKQDTLTAGSNISISSNTISADGYVWDASTGSFAEKYKQDAGEGGQVLANTANALGAHAEGYGTTASGDYGSHAEGNVSVASGYVSHAEGNRTTSSGVASHAEGIHTTASSKGAHAEGAETNATGIQSHAEGGFTTAQGLNSHAEGEYTIATNLAEHSEGNYNISHTANNTYGNAGNTQHSVGIGSPSTHKNAFEIMQNGDMYVIRIGGYQGTDTKVQDASILPLQDVIANIFVQLSSLDARVTALEPTPPSPSQPNDEIWYTTNNNEAITIDSESVGNYFDKPMLSNTYSDGKGIIKFDGDLTNILMGFQIITEDYENITSVQLPESVTELTYGTFEYCSNLVSVKLPSNYTDGIPEQAFNECSSLESIEIPEGTTFIGDSAFLQCSSLTTATIPLNVKYVGYSAFNGCSSLESIICEPTTPPSPGYAFEDTNDCPIYVPAESVNAYKTAEGWTEYANRIEAIQ